jgi:hypothetical protein
MIKKNALIDVTKERSLIFWRLILIRMKRSKHNITISS